MKNLVLILMAASVALTSAAAFNQRSIYDFGQFISCLADISLFRALDYNGYGCYCGYGGYGVPLDSTDRCCKLHDDCYTKATTSEIGCSSFQTYTISYDYSEFTDANGHCAIQCKDEKNYPASDTEARCRAFMCECDRQGAQCFADERSSFSSNHVSYDKGTC